MQTTKKLIIIGIIFIITIGLFIWGFSFLKGNSLFKKDYDYYAVYENVAGLTKGSAVTISGYQVGQIVDVTFTKDVVPKVVVHIILEKNIKIPLNSVAEIYSMDLMGTKAIRLIFNQSANDYYTTGDTLISAIEKDLKQEVNEQILPLKLRTEELLASFDSVLFLVQVIFSKNESNIYNSINNISLTIKNLEHTTYMIDTMFANSNSRINRTITSLANLATLLDKNQDTLKSFLANLDKISDSLANSDLKGLVNNTRNSLTELNAILTKINNGEGSLGQLLNNDSLYYNLEEMTLNINILLRDIKNNPKRYINMSLINFGKYYQTAPEERKKRTQ